MITHLGMFLRDVRNSRHESQRKMAERLGVTPAFLSQIEHGKRGWPRTWYKLVTTEYDLSKKERKTLDEYIEEMASEKYRV